MVLFQVFYFYPFSTVVSTSEHIILSHHLPQSPDPRELFCLSLCCTTLTLLKTAHEMFYRILLMCDLWVFP